VQAIGRALRKSPGKKYGYIFLPLLVNNADNVEAEISGNEFKVVWDVLNAMMEQDSELSDTVANLGKVGGQQTGDKVLYDPLLQFLTVNNANLRKLIEVKVLTRLTSNWDKMYEELCDYKAKHNSVKVLKSFPNPELHKWMKSQRNNRQRLIPSRKKLLDEIGFDWNRMQTPRPWGEIYEELREYMAKHGQAPSSRTQNQKLYSFVERQRSDFKQGKLTTHKYTQLKEIGIKFYSKILHKDGPEHEKNNMLWGEQYKALCAYQKIHGTTHVPQRGENAFLGKWVCAQREAWRKKELHTYRYEMLTNINFEFDPAETLWRKRFDEFNNYKGKEESMSQELKSWCGYQRRALQKKILPEEKLKLLKDANFRFERVQKFSYLTTPITEHDRFNELVDHYKQNKTWSIPKSNVALASMAKHIRSCYRLKKLHKDSIKILGKLGFPWNPEVVKMRKTA